MNRHPVRHKFLDTTKFLWLGCILGVVQQFTGIIDYRLGHGRELVPVSTIMGGLSFWAGCILLLIFRNKAPAVQFRDILLLFAGLDLSYYTWQFINDIQPVFMHPDHYESSYIWEMLGGAALDFLWYTSIGAMAGLWGMFASKFRNKGWRKRYIAMLAPLFAVIGAEMLESSIMMVQFIIQASKHQLITENRIYDCPIAAIITEVTALFLCIRAYKKINLTT